MQANTRGGLRTIKIIAHDRVAYRRQMQAQLVRAPGDGRQL